MDNRTYIRRIRWTYVLAIVVAWPICIIARRQIAPELERLDWLLLAGSMLLMLSWAMLRPDFPRILLFSAPFYGGAAPGADLAGRRFYWQDIFLLLLLALTVVEAVLVP